MPSLQTARACAAPCRRCTAQSGLGPCIADAALSDACDALARTYYEAVDRLAGDAFRADQEEQAQHVQQCEQGAA